MESETVLTATNETKPKFASSIENPPKKSYLPLILVVLTIFFVSIFSGIALGKYFYNPQTITPIPTLTLKPTINQIPHTTYTACGCGCCSEAMPKVQCLYRSKGDSMERIIKEDQKVKNSPQCATVGCSTGITYKYCD